MLDVTVVSKNKYYYITEPLKQKPIWAQDWWPDCSFHSFTTRNDAVRILKSQPNLGVFAPSPAQPKLTASVRNELRELKLKRIKYEVPSKFDFKFFGWTLHTDGRLLICHNPYSRFPLGWHEFNEDKSTPPNRAYLKLWEVLTLNYISLKRSDRVVDLGASPGGWTWVLSDCAAKVYAVDRAPLADLVSARPNVSFSRGDAFAVQPGDFADCQWMFSDIICTPERLLDLVQSWQAKSPVRNYVCTVKFKGLCDFDILKRFLEFKNSRIIRLYQNKNEVTWIKQDDS